MGFGGEDLIAAAGLANGGINFAVAGVNSGVIGKGQELAANAVQKLAQSLRAARLAGAAGEQGIAGEEVLTYQIAGGASV